MKLTNIPLPRNFHFPRKKRDVLVVQNVISYRLYELKLDIGLEEFSFADFDGIINALHFTC